MYFTKIGELENKLKFSSGNHLDINDKTKSVNQVFEEKLRAYMFVHEMLGKVIGYSLSSHITYASMQQLRAPCLSWIMEFNELVHIQ